MSERRAETARTIALRLAGALLATSATALVASPTFACDSAGSTCTTASPGSFPVVGAGTVTVVVAADEAAPVRRAAQALAGDIGRVGGSARLAGSVPTGADGPVVVVGQAANLNTVLGTRRPDFTSLDGEWEAFRQFTLPSLTGTPMLVIAGSDPRGAAFGAYDLSERIGVSPWHYMADVPAKRLASLSIVPGSREDAPDVRYRGLFINDEDPAFGGWAREKFGGVNAGVYEHVFDALLRMKGNYIWPAMWGKSLIEDDPASLALAAETGVLLGTSHHEPLTRAHVEWERAKEHGEASGDWNYATNGEVLRDFWTAGMERFVASGADGVVTIGMRGDGDEAMSEDTAIPLLEQIVADQRAIIADTTGKPASETPQVWALYKEVQDYYDQGMEVPDDVILLFADDNWGQIRRLPNPERGVQEGGYGVYYHFDYVGGPRSYKWIDTIQTGKTWQQMNLAWERGARDLWIVNVGDIKPTEYPLNFFLDMAWDADAMDAGAIDYHSLAFVTETFGEENASDITQAMDKYAQLASRRKPELLDPSTYSATDWAERNWHWQRLIAEVQELSPRIPAAQRSAFFQLVEHRILALGNIYELYAAAAENAYWAERGEWAYANAAAARAQAAFARDSELDERYHALEGGKWIHMMDQTRIGYTAWNDPPENVMPEVTTRTGIAARTPPEDWYHRFDPAGAATRSADRADAKSDGAGISWGPIPHLGTYGFAMASMPQGRPATTPADDVSLDYTVNAREFGDYRLTVQLVPTLDTYGDTGLRFGVQLDDGPVHTMTARLDPTNGATDTPAQAAWVEAVIENGVDLSHVFEDVAAGQHRVTIYRIDDNVVLDWIRFEPEG